MKFFNTVTFSTFWLLGCFFHVFAAQMEDGELEKLPPRDFRNDPIELQVVTQLTGDEVGKLVGTYEEDVKGSYYDNWDSYFKDGILVYHFALGNYTIEHGFNSYYSQYPDSYKRKEFNVVTIKRRTDKPYYRFVSSQPITTMPEGLKPVLGIIHNNKIEWVKIPGYVRSVATTPTVGSGVATPVHSSGYTSLTPFGVGFDPVHFSKATSVGARPQALLKSNPFYVEDPSVEANKAGALPVENVSDNQASHESARSVFTFKNATKAAAATVIIGATCYVMHKSREENVNPLEFVKQMFPNTFSFSRVTNGAANLVDGVTKSLSTSIEKAMSSIRSYF